MRERAPAQPNSRTGQRNLAVSPAAHDSLRLPRKTMPSEATGRTIPHACHAKRTLRARFPTPATRIHVRDTSGATFPHTCHVKRTRTNVQMHVSPHLPRGSTLQCLPERGHASGVPGLPRETHVTSRHITRARNTPRRQSPRHGAADTAPRHACGTPAARPIPAACHAKRTFAMRARNTPRTQFPRHGAAACPRHASNTPDPRSLPRERDKNVHGATRTRSQCTRRHSGSVAPSRIPAQGHGFENLVVATPPP